MQLSFFENHEDDENEMQLEVAILTEKIINRQGTDICRMEKAIMNIDDVENGYEALRIRLELIVK